MEVEGNVGYKEIIEFMLESSCAGCSYNHVESFWMLHETNWFMQDNFIDQRFCEEELTGIFNI